MQIEKNKVVTANYRVTEPGGVLLEDSDDAPITFLHGHNTMIESVEAALVGKGAGDKIEITVENAYGERDENKLQRVSINHIVREGKAKPKLKPGMMVYLNTADQGYLPVTVIKMGLKAVDVDTNHPFAGKTLQFNLEVLNVRDATADEISHGHVHGEGGVQH